MPASARPVSPSPGVPGSRGVDAADVATRTSGPVAGTLALSWPRTLAPLLGAAAACGFQPLALWPVTIAAVAVLIALLARAARWREAALIGWLFGVGHFTVGDYWIATAFTYQANMPAWLGGIAVVLLALYLAIYPALAATAAWRLARWRDGADRDGPARVGWLLAACWIIAEWLRGWVFTGFAWNPLGVALLGGDTTPGLAALAPYVGTYGLSGVLVGIAALLHAGWPGPATTRAPGRTRRAALVGLGAFALILAMQSRLGPHADAPGPVRFTLVQPNIPQPALDDPRAFEASFRRTAALSPAPAGLPAGSPRLVLWPESGVPDYLRDGYPQSFYDGMTYGGDPDLARTRLGRVAGTGATLLTGAVDLVVVHDRVVAARNVVTAIAADGAIVGSYAKAHLVPYGEYLALRWLLAPLGATRLVPGSIDFLPGPGPRTLDLGPLGRAGLQICYEIIFSGQVVDRAHRPDYIFNPSNEGWFGAWAQPQFLAQARLRAIEEGLPVLRATTTGISVVIDAHGIVRRRIAGGAAGRIDGLIPRALPATPFARAGNALPLVLAGLLLVLRLAPRWRVAPRRPSR